MICCSVSVSVSLSVMICQDEEEPGIYSSLRAHGSLDLRVKNLYELFGLEVLNTLFKVVSV